MGLFCGILGTMQNGRNLGVCVVVLDPEGNVLLGKRKNGYGAGFYGLPGGHVELGEPLVAAAARELYEETGLTNQSLEFLGVVREYQYEIDFVHFIYVLKTVTAEPKLSEPDKCEGWEWKNPQEPAHILRGHQQALILLSADGKTATAVRDVPKETNT